MLQPGDQHIVTGNVACFTLRVEGSLPKRGKLRKKAPSPKPGIFGDWARRYWSARPGGTMAIEADETCIDAAAREAGYVADGGITAPAQRGVSRREFRVSARSLSLGALAGPNGLPSAPRLCNIM
jgi:hypothetical protein